jgi:hypothetical protein
MTISTYFISSDLKTLVLITIRHIIPLMEMPPDAATPAYILAMVLWYSLKNTQEPISVSQPLLFCTLLNFRYSIDNITKFVKSESLLKSFATSSKKLGQLAASQGSYFVRARLPFLFHCWNLERSQGINTVTHTSILMLCAKVLNTMERYAKFRIHSCKFPLKQVTCGPNQPSLEAPWGIPGRKVPSL